MSVNLGNLELTLIQKINSLNSPLEIKTYTKALEKIKSGMIYSVDTFSSLPSFTDSLGMLYYVVDEEAVYIAENYAWVSFGSNNNIMLGWGCSSYGALPCPCFQYSPIQEVSCSRNWCCALGAQINTYGLKMDGTVWSQGYPSLGQIPGPSCSTTPVRECTSSTWTHLSAYHFGGHAIKNDGTLWGWGRNNNGVVGNNCTAATPNSPVQEVSSSTNWFSTFAKTSGLSMMNAIKTDGTLWAWGYNLAGSLGDGTNTNRSSPVQEASSSTNWCYATADGYNMSGIKTDGTLWMAGHGTCGKNGDGYAGPACKSSPVQEICSATNWCTSHGAYCTGYGIKMDGTLWAWGSGLCGMLGNNCTNNATSPIQEITSSTNWCTGSGSINTAWGIKTDGTLWGWGAGGLFLLGTDSGTAYSSPVLEPYSLCWTQINATSNKIVQAVTINQYL